MVLKNPEQLSLSLSLSLWLLKDEDGSVESRP
jgi:hypothetical protein